MIGTIIRTIVSRFLLLCIMVLYFIPILIFICVPQKRRYSSRIIFWFVHVFYWLALKCSLLSIIQIGTENIPDKASIFAMNHQSSFDIPLAGILAHGPHIWLAKYELMESPILRWVLPLFAVLVDVSSPKRAMASLRTLLALVNGNKRHLMIFPEGGRYTDGAVHPFFGGFVILAKKTGMPVVPVYIANVGKVYPPDSFWVRNEYPIKVIIGTPFVYGEGDTDESFKNKVYAWFIEQNALYQ
jgi:1-acyl-sn-glycerol-3-phosphate acyltransferase